MRVSLHDIRILIIRTPHKVPRFGETPHIWRDLRLRAWTRAWMVAFDASMLCSSFFSSFSPCYTSSCGKEYQVENTCIVTQDDVGTALGIPSLTPHSLPLTFRLKAQTPTKTVASAFFPLQHQTLKPKP